jgi:biopolymer transport protein ExbD
MDMTPLIDCVFLLIMFFILTTQITVQIEAVDLPFALEGKRPPPEGDPTVILNVRINPRVDTFPRQGEIVYQGKVINKVDELSAALKDEAIYDRDVRNRKPEFTKSGKELSQLEVLIRHDRDVQAEHLRTIFEACMNAGIYKIKVASTQPTEG